jgi:hypothetical protein
MKGIAGRVVLASALLAGAVDCGRKGEPAMPEPFPAAIGDWRADGPTKTYDPRSIFSYLDGGAEVYLAYGMQTLATRRYVRDGETPLVADLFEMATPAGAYGMYTFELEGPTIELGQGAELAAGMLRFWQGRCFGTVRAEQDSAAAEQAILLLGRVMVAACGAPAPGPELPAHFAPEGLRPLSVRYVLGPELLAWQERSMEGNPLGLDPGAEAIVARYGPLGERTRLIVAHGRDAAAAQAGVERVRASFGPQADAEEFAAGAEGTWNVVRAVREYVLVVREAPTRERAQALLDATARRLEAVTR